MDKAKVFYLVYGLTSGGIENYSVNLFKHIDKKNIQIDFIVKFSRHEFFDDDFYAAGGKKIAINIENKGKLAYLINTIRIAKSGYNVGYFNLSNPSDVFKYPLICRLAGIKKIIIHSHNSSEDSHNFIKNTINWISRKLINRISSVKLACSDKAAIWMFGKANDYILINNGIEVDKFVYKNKVRKEIRDELQCNENTVLLGHVGRFVKQKNHFFLINVFEKYIKLNSNSKLLLIGVGPYFHQIKALVKEKNLEDKVVFLGEKNNVNDYLQAMDLFLLPSLYEGLPISGVEAQASGLKCLFSNSISKDTKITDNVEFINLDSGAEYWANKIKDNVSYNRIDQSQAVIEKGFDIATTSKIIENCILGKKNSVKLRYK